MFMEEPDGLGACQARHFLHPPGHAFILAQQAAQAEYPADGRLLGKGEDRPFFHRLHGFLNLFDDRLIAVNDEIEDRVGNEIRAFGKPLGIGLQPLPQINMRTGRAEANGNEEIVPQKQRGLAIADRIAFGDRRRPRDDEQVAPEDFNLGHLLRIERILHRQRVQPELLADNAHFLRRGFGKPHPVKLLGRQRIAEMAIDANRMFSGFSSNVTARSYDRHGLMLQALSALAIRCEAAYTAVNGWRIGMTDDTLSGETPDFDVVIVGAGISGIGMAAHLSMQCPGKRFVILDRRDQIGGTWDLFRYPGIRSDSDMYTLGYRFAPWREDETIASGNRILAYLARVAEEHDITRHIRFGQHVAGADWDSAARLWRVTAKQADGSTTTVTGRFLIMGTGYYDYDNPHDPQIPSLADFGGMVLHPQFWPHDFDYTGKRIVVIGSGATAVTMVPSMTDKADHVTMLQRTPTWYLIRPSRDVLANRLRRWLPEKWAYALVRLRNTRMQEFLFHRARENPAGVANFLKSALKAALGDRYSEADFTPPYSPWDQRLCLVPDADMFKAMHTGKASVATGAIRRVVKDGIELEDGRKIEADVIVTATGLQLAALGKAAISLDGQPVDIAQHYWYRNCMFSNVPNFAAIFGYLNAGWTLRVDIVGDWLCRLLTQMDAWNAEVATPTLPDDHGLEEYQPFDLFSSGYLQRGKHLMPRNATIEPWRIHMDYRTDKAEMEKAQINDGWMHFDRQRTKEPA